MKIFNVGLITFFKTIVTQMRHILIATFLVVLVYWLSAINLANPVSLIGVIAFVLFAVEWLDVQLNSSTLYDEIKSHLQDAGGEGMTLEELFHKTDIAKDDIKEYMLDMLKAGEVVELNQRFVLKV